MLEDLTSVKSAAEICREHQLKPQVLTHRKPEFSQRVPESFATNPSGEDKERTVELERMIGRLTMELEVAKKASSILTSLSSRSER